ncbi:MAG: trypsin-like peptidase domain-containing protein [Leifsonia sp.]
MTESNTTPDDAAAQTPANPESEQTSAAVNAPTGPTEAIAPEVPAAQQPVAGEPAAAPAQPTGPTTPIAPVAAQPAATQPAAAQPAPAAAQPAPVAQPAPAHQHTAPTDAFGQPVAPQATVYAPNTAPQAYAQAPGHPTQPTQPYAAAPGTGVGAPVSGPTTKRRGTLPIVAALIAGALIGGASSAGVAAVIANNDGTSQTASTTTPQNVVVNDSTSVNEITAVAAKASPSVVTISVTASGSGGTGSGIVLSKDGYVLTNTHVVTLDGSASDVSIQVETSDGKLYAAKLVGTDPVSDLAVIKLTDASGLTPLDFADSSKLNVGDAAIAIGAPLGLSGTVTNGIVSALNRSIQVASSAAPDSSGDTQAPSTPDDQGQGFDFWNFDMPGQEQQSTQPTSTISLPVIQTDAAINPGNSGGALLNSKGELIGVNVAIASAGATAEGSQSGSIGVGFAIPANLAKRVADEIINDGKASHGMLGASVQDATSAEAGVVGALIKEVVSGGAAADAGLKEGDIVTNFNGVPISNATDLTAQVRYLAAGEKAELTYTRDGKSSTATVTLGEYSAN